jgi:hypothetical protein
VSIQIGSRVRVTAPFDATLPGEFTVVGQNSENGAWQTEVDGSVSDFAPEYLEEVA